MDLRSRALPLLFACAAFAGLYYSIETALGSSQASAMETSPQSVLGTPLEVCSTDPLTGYMRDGYCKLTESDTGTHVVCAQVTTEFLEFTKTRGNDLQTPAPMYRFPGLKEGDRWCLCALRWKEAYAADPAIAPRLVLGSTHEHALHFVPMETLKSKAVN